jgi:anthranilate synthase/aminodeoxychorismate synthase-like glutamine amidotransferase
MILLIDNYDSFTFNLYQLIAGFDVQVKVVRNDAHSVDELLAMNPQAVVLSPGPGRPENAGVLGELIAALPDEVPLLGVCLGHQALALAMGGELLVQEEPVHGRATEVTHRESRLLAGLPSPFLAARYHSLHVDPNSISGDLRVVAQTADGTVMAVEHRHLPRFGVQFHPESILQEGGNRLMENFLNLVDAARPTAQQPVS